MINLNAGACVRSLIVDSSCHKCELICPTNAIVIGQNPLPSINHSLCVSCGVCDAICNSEALSLDEFKQTDFFFEFIEGEDKLISCKKNIPCIAALNVETLISIAVLNKEIVFDMGHCEKCDIAHKCKPQILSIYEEATYILEAMQSDAKITLEEVAFTSEVQEQKQTSRREMFDIKTLAKSKQSFEQEIIKATDELTEYSLAKTDIALLRKKTTPDKRKLFFTAMKRAKRLSVYHVIDANEISFTSSKILDVDTCTACQMCYRVCPTGALSSDVKNSKIDFDPFICIKCNVCHDVCEPNAITLSPSYDIKEFFEPSVVNLVKFSVKRCNECNVIFSTNELDAQLCFRCEIEDDEARTLHKIEEKY